MTHDNSLPTSTSTGIGIADKIDVTYLKSARCRVFRGTTQVRIF